MRITKLNVAFVGVIVANILLTGCSRGQTKNEAAPREQRPDVRVNLSAYGLPRNFFEPGADTKCASQIIGYRFVVWLNNDNVAVGFNTSPNCRPSPDRKVSGSARLLIFSASGVFKVQR